MFRGYPILMGQTRPRCHRQLLWRNHEAPPFVPGQWKSSNVLRFLDKPWTNRLVPWRWVDGWSIIPRRNNSWTWRNPRFLWTSGMTNWQSPSLSSTKPALRAVLHNFWCLPKKTGPYILPQETQPTSDYHFWYGILHTFKTQTCPGCPVDKHQPNQSIGPVSEPLSLQWHVCSQFCWSNAYDKSYTQLATHGDLLPEGLPTSLE